MLARFVAIFLLLGMARCAQAQSASLVVDHAAQKERDLDRRLVLGTELRAELEELAKAQAAFDASPTSERGVDVHRHVENIKALQRELDGAAGDAQEKRSPTRVIVKARGSSTTSANKSPQFWDPYNRAPDPTVFPTNP